MGVRSTVIRPFALAAALAVAWLSTPAAAAGDEVRAQWWFGARLSLSPGSVSENGGKRKVTVTAEVSEWGTSSPAISATR